jgi:hypothetical protein
MHATAGARLGRAPIVLDLQHSMPRAAPGRSETGFADYETSGYAASDAQERTRSDGSGAHVCI